MNEERSNASRAGRQKWHLLTVLPVSTSAELVAEARVHPASPWFSGHFPQEPILPGIAQIAMVLETIQQAKGSKWRLAGLKRIRFKQVIQPEDVITIRVLGREKENAYSFQLAVDKEIACSGILSVTATDAGKKTG